MSKRSARGLIVNADDFGLSSPVNEGIIMAFRDGIVTSTTLMVNQPGFEDGVRLAEENPELAVGLHVTLIWGAPVTDPARLGGLVDRRGRLPASAAAFAARYAAGRVRREAIETEVRAQLQRFLATGLTPSHVDTHKHVHCLPGVLEVLLSAAAECDIDRVRVPLGAWSTSRPRMTGIRPAPARWARGVIVRRLARNARDTVARTRFRTTDNCLEIEYAGRSDAAALATTLEALPEGITELMCHPGLDDRQIPGRLGGWRARELEALTSERAERAVKEQGIRLLSFRDL